MHSGRCTSLCMRVSNIRRLQRCLLRFLSCCLSVFRQLSLSTHCPVKHTLFISKAKSCSSRAIFLSHAAAIFAILLRDCLILTAFSALSRHSLRPRQTIFERMRRNSFCQCPEKDWKYLLSLSRRFICFAMGTSLLNQSEIFLRQKILKHRLS